MRMRLVPSAVVCCLLWAAVLAAQEDILVITLDTTRADHLSCYGYPRATSPFMDAFAEGARRFTRAYTPVPYTLPAHVSMFTGLWPKDHGVRNNILAPVRPSVVSAASLLRTDGYLTAAFVSSFVLDRRFGLDHGFARYDDRMTLRDRTDEQNNERPAQDTERAVIDYLSDLPQGGRVFLWVHLFDPHHPYRAHAGTPAGWSVYDGEILHMDRSIGRILAEWDRRRQGLVVITADHGESLGDHGESYHGIFLYEPCVRVPMLVRAAGRTVPGTDDRLASLTDIAATILDFAGISGPPGPGRSLLSSAALHDRLYFESFVPADNFGWAAPFGIYKDGLKYIRLPRPELYDLTRDPGETKNLAGARRPKTRELGALLEEGYGTRYDPPAGVPDRETAKRLEALGYRGGSTVRGDRDPKDLVWVVDAMERARALEKGNHPAGAETIYRRILRENPENAPARVSLSSMLKSLGRRGDARGVLQEGLEHNPSDPIALYNLGVLDYEENRLPEARNRFRAVLLRLPEHLDSLFSLFWIAVKSGDGNSARDILARVGQIAPQNPDLFFFRGLQAAQEGDLAAAVDAFNQCLVRQPDHVDALNGLGKAFFQLGYPEKAVEPYRKSLETNPDQPQIYLHLGSILLNFMKDPDGALKAFRAFLSLYPTDAEAPRVRQIVEEIPLQ